MKRTERQAAERRGRHSEQLAALALRLKGYRILARNVKRPVGEIDIIACRAKALAFVEVKRRRTLDAALLAVPQKSWTRIARAAEQWAALHPEFTHHAWRFDLIIVRPGRWPQHLADFWRPGGI